MIKKMIIEDIDKINFKWDDQNKGYNVRGVFDNIPFEGSILKRNDNWKIIFPTNFKPEYNEYVKLKQFILKTINLKESKLIKEMPYINYGNYKIFDLELENIKTSQDLINYIDRIFNGQVFRDKHGNIIKLVTRDEKVDFLKELQTDTIFQSIIRNKLTDNERKLLDLLIEKEI